jgi:DNA-binding NtrC family response regulator
VKKTPLSLSAEALEQLRTYRWPGNVRELQNCIERAVILAEGDSILPRHLNLSFAAPLSAEDQPGPWDQIDLSGSLSEVTRRTLAEVERRKIEQVMQETERNKGRTAELLQISYKMLLSKLKEHKID